MIRTPFFSLRTRKNDEGRGRIGVVVGLAVSKKAALRNFWKRQARSAMQPYLKMSRDFIVTLSPKVVALTRKRFREEIGRTVGTINN